MLTIDDYIEKAKFQLGTRSERRVAKELGLSNVQVNYWRNRKSMPSDENMAKLAKLAGMDIGLALLRLSWWRCVAKDDYLAATHYLLMIEELQKKAA